MKTKICIPCRKEEAEVCSKCMLLSQRLSYNKAIDDFVKECKMSSFYIEGKKEALIPIIWIEETAKELKKNEN